MRSRRPPNAESGMPPPITLPSVTRSGVTPYRPAAPRGPTRKPVITSSKMRQAPDRSARGGSPSRNPRAGGAGAGRDEEAVGGAVVAPGDLDPRGAAGGGACEPYRARRGLGAGHRE